MPNCIVIFLSLGFAVGEAAVQWLLRLDGGLEVSWLDQLANFNEDKQVRLTWQMDGDIR